MLKEKRIAPFLSLDLFLLKTKMGRRAQVKDL